MSEGEEAVIDTDAELISATQDEGEPAPEGTTEEPEPPGESQETVEAEVEAVEVEAVEGEAEGEEVDPAEALKPFMDEKGAVDLGKLARSYKEKEKLLGKTAKDREEVSKIRAEADELKKQAELLRQFQDLAQVNPNIAHEVQRAQQIKLGVVPNKEAELTREEVSAQHRELMVSGKYLEAAEFAERHSPVYKELQETKRKLESYEKSQAKSSDEKSYEAFKSKYGKLLWNEDGSVRDQDLFKATSSLVDELGNVQGNRYEAAFVLASHRTGKSIVKSGTTPGKKAAAQIPTKTSKPAVKKRGDYETEIQGLGISERALLGY